MHFSRGSFTNTAEDVLCSMGQRPDFKLSLGPGVQAGKKWEVRKCESEAVARAAVFGRPSLVFVGS